jgi:hypothetical protein
MERAIRRLRYGTVSVNCWRAFKPSYAALTGLSHPPGKVSWCEERLWLILNATKPASAALRLS